ncbi:HipA family kinase [Clavibacter sp. VKM Ac-2872]|uniref:HipA family kinase n=1 Tax=Clavibacter sp. VKM Ac-2872 TaxID=2783812 RepID=UPI00188A7D3A|nr:HipA family kinase [Clavibacter sp. VKM Ac-2872]MBF4624941.1 hypothetical protein [Clavibacter sp. VKM Ac-2872]
MPVAPMAPLLTHSLVAVLRRSESGSKAFLGLASDGRHYWVKPWNNPQGARTLVAELIAYRIGWLIGAPVPEHALLTIPNNFVDSYADGLRLHQGTCHASLNLEDVIESDEWDTYSRLDDNAYRQAFIVGLWDLCLGGDPQWLHQTKEDQSIWTFDHGMWLAGEADWDLPSLRRIGTSEWQHDVDTSVTSDLGLLAAADAIDSLSLEDFQAVVSLVPLEWDTDRSELAELASILFVRSEAVAARLRRAASNHSHDT